MGTTTEPVEKKKKKKKKNLDESVEPVVEKIIKVEPIVTKVEEPVLQNGIVEDHEVDKPKKKKKKKMETEPQPSTPSTPSVETPKSKKKKKNNKEQTSVKTTVVNTPVVIDSKVDPVQEVSKTKKKRKRKSQLPPPNVTTPNTTPVNTPINIKREAPSPVKNTNNTSVEQVLGETPKPKKRK